MNEPNEEDIQVAIQDCKEGTKDEGTNLLNVASSGEDSLIEIVNEKTSAVPNQANSKDNDTTEEQMSEINILEEIEINEALKVLSNDVDKEQKSVEQSSNIEQPCNDEKVVCKVEQIKLSSYDEVKRFLQDYYEQSSTRFNIATITKKFGAATAECITDGHSVVWLDDTYDELVDYTQSDGIPRMVVGRLRLQCQYGKNKRRKETDEENTKKRRSSYLKTKKLGCPAKINIRQVVRFPEFKLVNLTKYLRASTSKKLKEKLKTSREDVKMETYFLIQLPPVTEHLYHDISDIQFFLNREPVHDNVRSKIMDLYIQNFTRLEIQNKLRDYVINEMFFKELPPSECRRRYYPNRKDVLNIIYRYKELANLNHEQIDRISNYCESLKHSESNTNVYVIWDYDEEVVVENEVNSESSEDEFFESEAKPIPAKKAKIVRKKKEDNIMNAPYLFCYQTVMQQRLIKRYGEILFIVKCCNYRYLKNFVPFNVYLLMVQTNVDYQPVGVIFVSKARKKGLSDGLVVFKHWNAYWRPQLLMIDCFSDVIEAVQDVFPDSTYMFTTHSCQREWSHFLQIPSNELADYSEDILSHFTNMMFSFTEDSLTEAASIFESSKCWRDSQKLRDWFQTDWLPSAKKWVYVYHPTDLLLVHHLPVTMVDCIDEYERLLTSYQGMRLGVLDALEKIPDLLLKESYNLYLKRNKELDFNCNSFIKSHTVSSIASDVPLPLLPYFSCMEQAAEMLSFSVSEEEIGNFTVTCEDIYKTEKRQEQIEVTDVSNCSVKTALTDFTISPLGEALPLEVQAKRNNMKSNLPKTINEKFIELDGTFTISFGDQNNFCFCSCSFWQLYKLPCVHMIVIFKSNISWQYDMMSSLYRMSNIFKIDRSSGRSTKQPTLVDKECGAHISRSTKSTQTKSDFSNNFQASSKEFSARNALVRFNQSLEDLTRLLPAENPKLQYKNLKSVIDIASQKMNSLLTPAIPVQIKSAVAKKVDKQQILPPSQNSHKIVVVKGLRTPGMFSKPTSSTLDHEHVKISDILLKTAREPTGTRSVNISKIDLSLINKKT